MRRLILLAALCPVSASAAPRAGSVAVEAGGGDMTAWLALSALLMVVALLAAHRLVTRGPKR